MCACYRAMFTSAYMCLCCVAGVTVPDEFTGEEVFATQLNEDDYPGLRPDTDRKRTSCYMYSILSFKSP